MSILNFSEHQFFIDLRSDSDSQEVKLGSFTQSHNSKLKHMRIFSYYQGAFTNEEMVLRITDSLTSPTVTYVSDPLLPANIEGVGTHWLGWVRFDFNKEFIVDGTEYFMTISTANYTEGASKYIGFAYDFPNIQNEGQIGQGYNQYCVKFQLYGLE